MCSLPIHLDLPRLRTCLSETQNLVVLAPPASGKTSVIPLWLANEFGLEKSVVVEPRRIAARMAASFVASSLGQVPGQTVGYEVKLDTAVSAATRLRYVTDGVFVQHLLRDPRLAGMGAVVVDELHERRLMTDFALAWARHLQTTQAHPLRVVAMSATLDPKPVAQVLGGCSVAELSHQPFPVEVSYVSMDPRAELERVVVSQVREALARQAVGDILVFLPGTREIELAVELTASLARDLNLHVLPLHGRMPANEQDAALRPSDQRKVIFSTNVAESSITIPGVRCVIDSGLARVATHSPWSGLTRLKLEKICRASADQRAGRAGRQAPGICVRLYSAADYAQRPAFDEPEIVRADLSSLVLLLRAIGIANPGELPWLTAPPEASIEQARELLRSLGALTSAHELTPLGREMSQVGAHPRWVRALIEGRNRGVAAEVAWVIAVIEEGLHERMPHGDQMARGPWMDLVDQALEQALAAGRGRAQASLQRLSLAQKQVLRSIPGVRGSTGDEDDVRMALLAGFADRVARRSSGLVVSIATGPSAHLQPRDDRASPFLLAVDAQEKLDQRGRKISLSAVVRLEPVWLLDSFADEIVSEQVCVWNSSKACVETVDRTVYRGIVLEQSTSLRRHEAASAVLAKQVIARGIHSLFAKDELAQLQRRVLLLHESGKCEVRELSTERLEELVGQACAGLVRMDELDPEALKALVRCHFTPSQWTALERLVPVSVRLGSGRSAPVHYEPDQRPWIESRLQDFFGATKGPSLLDGRLPLVLHLLAPNGRAVQVTDDLEGFWVKHYPSIRRELCRRYPKHAWPEDGATAQPPVPRQRRT